jgi:hypothetical protein
MGKAFDNGSIPTKYGDVDLDWYATGIQFDYPPGGSDGHAYDFTYVAGKLAWSGGRAIGSMFNGHPRPFPLPYQDQKEVRGQDLLRQGKDHFSDLFPPDWLKKNCPC